MKHLMTLSAVLSYFIIVPCLFQCRNTQVIEVVATKKYQNFLWLSKEKIQLISVYKEKYTTKEPYSFFQSKICKKAKKKAKKIAENKFPKLKFINYNIKFIEILYVSLNQCKVSSIIEAKNLKAKIE